MNNTTQNINSLVNRLVQLFPLWAILLSLVAYWQPLEFTGLKPAIIPLLGVIMFGMGITLRPADFSHALKQPGLILLGVFMQFLMMPFFAWGISMVMALPPMIFVGMVLLGASPGGTASNVITYLAKGDLALSITLTTISTLVAVIATPYLTLWYAGQVVPVDASAMLFSVLKIVLLPVFLGVLVNYLLGDKLRSFKHIFPLISVIAIVIIIAIVVALNAARLADMALILVFAVMLHNAMGLLGGYGISKLLGHNEKTCRTLAIEVGMQNSGLAVALAGKYFGAAAALPGALFSIWHNLSGSILAAIWRIKKNSENVDYLDKSQ